jgi:hypothetical protein
MVAIVLHRFTGVNSNSEDRASEIVQSFMRATLFASIPVKPKRNNVLFLSEPQPSRKKDRVQVGTHAANGTIQRIKPHQFIVFTPLTRIDIDSIEARHRPRLARRIRISKLKCLTRSSSSE